MEEMLINERFKSPNKEFEKVYAIFDKRDYFNNKGLAKTQIGNFKRALEKNDKGAQKLLDAHKGNMDSAISYIEEFISDSNKKKSFESFQEFSSMVNALEMSTKPNLKQKPAEFVKRRIHNNSQKYTIALYSAIRKQKFNNYKDVHKDVDNLISKNESVNEAISRSYYLQKYDEDGNGKKVAKYSKFDKSKIHSDFNRYAKTLKDEEELHFMGINTDKKRVGDDYLFSVVNQDGKNRIEITKGNRTFYKPFKSFKLESVNEGKKRFKRQDGIGKAKYTVSYHDGKKKHKDGSDFFDIKIFKNKKDLSDFVGTLAKQGYKLTREGINEFDSKSMKAYGNAVKKAYGSNKASREAMGIAGFTGTRGSAVQKFIDDYNLNARKLFNFVKKGNLKDRMALVSAIAGKPNNKMFKMITKQFSESTDGVPQGYNPMVEDKQEIKNLLKKVGNKETKFYDVLNTIEKKYGKNKYRIWLEKSLKSFGANPKHYDYRTNAGAEEKLFQLGK